MDELKQLREIIRDELQLGLQTLKADVSGLKADVSGLKADVSGIKKDIQILKKSDRQIRKEIKLMLNYLDRSDSNLHKRVTRIEGHLHLPAFDNN